MLNYNFTLSIYFSIYIYIITIFIIIIYIYLINFYTELNNSIKFIILDSSIKNKINFFLFLGSLIGIPPLMGFFTKIIIFSNLLFFHKYSYMFIFLILNLFLLIFYLQQIRFSISNKKKLFFFKNNVDFIYMFWNIIIFFQFINVFSIIFIPYLFNMFILISSI